MRVRSVNVGLVRTVPYRDTFVQTGIFKTPVTGPVRVGADGLVGDAQADLTVHGGVIKSVYVYPAEHYAFWRHELPGLDLPWGMFGENLTTDGVLERDVRVGDRVDIGSAAFTVTRPRNPCFKLGIRFGRPDIIRRFWRSGRSGFYLSVAVQGSITAGDALVVRASDPTAPTIAEVFGLAAARIEDD